MKEFGSKKLRSISIFVVLCLTSFILGRASTLQKWGTSGDKKEDNKNEDSSANQIREGGYRFINPLLECELSNGGSLQEFAPLRADIDKKIDGLKSSGLVDHVSLYFRDLNNGPWIGVQEKEFFKPASLAKIPVLLAYLKLQEASPSFLMNEVSFENPVTDISQHFQAGEPLKVDNKYTLEELLIRMIRYSDNNATMLLVSSVPEEAIIKPFKDLGLTAPDTNKDFDIRVKDYASFFRVLYNASYLSKENSERALGLLTTTEFNSGLVAGVPSNVTVAHKFGEREIIGDPEKQLHDCGIIYYPNHPYLLCIMTRGKNFEDLAQGIKELSKLVYTEVETKIGVK